MICAPAAARPVSEREHGPKDRERCEDGADDHRLTNDSKLGVCAGKGGGTVSTRRSRIKRTASGRRHDLGVTKGM
jgi:hypothetical protein